MAIQFSTSNIVDAICKLIDDDKIFDAKVLFGKNRQKIKAEMPTHYKMLSRKLNPPKQNKKATKEEKSSVDITTTNQEEDYTNEIKKHLDEACPIPAFEIYEKHIPISKEDFLAMCKAELDSEKYKNSMRAGNAAKSLKDIIQYLEGKKDRDTLFKDINIGVLSTKGPRQIKRGEHTIEIPSPKIEYKILSKPVEECHLDWIKEFARCKKSDYKELYENTRIQMAELSDDIKYADRDQRLDIIVERENERADSVQLHKDLQMMDTIANSPYFARVDYNDNTKNNIVYLYKNNGGQKNYPAEKDAPQSYADWRAPIGNLFFDTRDILGKAYYMGKNVDVMLNGSIVIEDGTLEYVESNVDDSILQGVLSGPSTEHLGEVVATIQTEQNSAIRHSGKEDLVIQGSAGSGKTIIGTHRIAYLLYPGNNENNAIKNDSMLFVSPNENFSEYISNVLPELGEDKMTVVTMNDIISIIFDSLKEKRNLEKFSHFVENYFKEGFDPEIADKYSEGFYDTFRKALTGLNKERIDLGLRSIMSPTANTAEIEERKMVLLRTYEKLFGDRRKTSYGDYERAVYVATMWAMLNNAELKLAKDNDVSSLLSEDDASRAAAAKRAYNDIMKDIRSKINEKASETIEGKTVYYNETTIDKEKKSGEYKLIRHIFEKKTKDYYPTDGHKSVLHIVVDEAQDYSPCHILLLKTVFPNAHFTILGDENQNLNPYYLDASLKALLPGADFINIKKAYRSSPEIVAYTNEILDEEIIPVRKATGIPVNEKTIDSISNVSKELLGDDFKSICSNGNKRTAIVCRDKETKKMAKTILEGYKGIKVFTTYEAKGLEFDAVIVFDTYSSKEKESLYTACTRAQHQLIVYRALEDKKKSEEMANRIRVKADSQKQEVPEEAQRNDYQTNNGSTERKGLFRRIIDYIKNIFTIQ